MDAAVHLRSRPRCSIGFSVQEDLTEDLEEKPSKSGVVSPYGGFAKFVDLPRAEETRDRAVLPEDLSVLFSLLFV